MKEWTIGINRYGGTSIFEGRKERYSNVQKLDCDFTVDELAGIVRDHNTAPELLQALKAALERLNYANLARTAREGMFMTGDIRDVLAKAKP